MKFAMMSDTHYISRRMIADPSDRESALQPEVTEAARLGGRHFLRRYVPYIVRIIKHFMKTPCAIRKTQRTIMKAAFSL